MKLKFVGSKPTVSAMGNSLVGRALRSERRGGWFETNFPSHVIIFFDMPFKSAKQRRWMFAYIAGLLDSDGCIYLNEEKKNGQVIRTRVRVQITNTYRPLVDACKEMLGCGFVGTTQTKEGWKTRYDYVLYGSDAVELLSKTLPYMHVKHQQAELAILFYKNEVEAEEARSLMSKFNRKGTYGAV